MGHIDHIEQAEDDCEAQGHQHHCDANRKTVDDLGGQNKLDPVHGGRSNQNLVQVSGPMAFAAATLPTISNWVLLTLTAYISCIAWWSPARMVFIP